MNVTINLTATEYNQLNDILNDTFSEYWDAAQRDNAHPSISEKAEFLRGLITNIEGQYQARHSISPAADAAASRARELNPHLSPTARELAAASAARDVAMHEAHQAEGTDLEASVTTINAFKRADALYYNAKCRHRDALTAHGHQR